ncbi:CBP4-domain-containing protein [Aspergillus violaceofuscus CBS 115571]|uniref:Cytochrome b mRNA-processing protein 4 n=1 Tax=Aspergillus violaceofuscus (strain CBS 115571) TaxID=1450538 RepID=A0A2V5HIC6_ASPV1|nr:CBP4-domain-containing protein [Aspergillus violaceofuscus CBS 115571]
MSRAGTWLKMLGVGVVCCVGGPAFVQYIRPTDEELFKRYNPDLQKRSLEEGDRRARDFDEYVTKLKEWSKSDKHSMLRSFSILMLIDGSSLCGLLTPLVAQFGSPLKNNRNRDA